jgi:hypothetical protein
MAQDDENDSILRERTEYFICDPSNGTYTAPLSNTITIPGGETREVGTLPTQTRADLNRYVLPLVRKHAQGSHGPGIAHGLRLSVSTKVPGALVISPGLAVDANGRHIALEIDGLADIYDHPSLGRGEAAGTFDGAINDLPRVSGSDTEDLGLTIRKSDIVTFVGGVLVSSKPVDRTYEVAISWMETLDQDSANPSAKSLQVHSPHVYLIDPTVQTDAELDKGLWIRLGKVRLDAEGRFTDIVQAPRHSVSVRVGDYAALRSLHDKGTSAGLRVTVPGEQDDVVFSTDIVDVPASGSQPATYKPLREVQVNASKLKVAGALEAGALTASGLSVETITVTGALNAGLDDDVRPDRDRRSRHPGLRWSRRDEPVHGHEGPAASADEGR